MRRTRRGYWWMVGQLMLAVVCWGMIAGGLVADDPQPAGDGEQTSEQKGKATKQGKTTPRARRGGSGGPGGYGAGGYGGDYDGGGDYGGGGYGDPFSAPDGSAEIRSFHLGHAESNYVVQFLGKMFGPPIARVFPDQRNNSIYVSAPPEVLALIASMIEEIDRPGRPESIRVYSLKYVEAGALATTLQSLQLQGVMNYAVDLQNNRIVVNANEETQQSVENLLQLLDVQSTRAAGPVQEPAATMRTVRVRAIWLVRSDKYIDADKVPLPKPSEDLADVVAELAEIGVDGLRQVGQTMVNTTNDGEFELSCSPFLSPERSQSITTNWTVQGSFLPSRDEQQTPRLKIQLTATNQDFGKSGGGAFGPGQLASITTEITAPYGHHVVLCATPMGDMTSVFVVQVTRVD